MMSRRKIVILAIILMAALALAACGGGDVDNGPTIGQAIARGIIKVLPTTEPSGIYRGIICPDHNDC